MIDLKRPLGSYAKVQAWYGRYIRNRAGQLASPRIKGLRYLNLGCGPNGNEAFINLDYFWRPHIDVCWDFNAGLPFGDASMQGIFSEHCLEHFSFRDGLSLLRECHRVLAPGGIMRVVVPDGEHYLRTYVRALEGDAAARFPFEADKGWDGCDSPILHVNRVFYTDRESPFGHQVIYDYALLEVLLRRVGFASVCRAEFGRGEDVTLLIDTEGRRPESLYLEARR
jgi:predicted SAM-dependent methyltransferase